MKIAIIPLALSLLLAQTQAAPASSNLEARQASTPDIVFQGAAGANFTLSGVPQDNTIFSITNPLSVSKIIVNIGATCTFNGTDGSSSFALGGTTAFGTVGPPQSQVSGACLEFGFPGQLCQPGNEALQCFPHPAA